MTITVHTTINDVEFGGISPRATISGRQYVFIDDEEMQPGSVTIRQEWDSDWTDLGYTAEDRDTGLTNEEFRKWMEVRWNG